MRHRSPVPAGVVTSWTLGGPGNSGTGDFEIDHGPGGTGFGDEPAPLTGLQIGLSRGDGNGQLELAMNLDVSGNYSLASFN